MMLYDSILVATVNTESRCMASQTRCKLRCRRTRRSDLERALRPTSIAVTTLVNDEMIRGEGRALASALLATAGAVTASSPATCGAGGALRFAGGQVLDGVWSNCRPVGNGLLDGGGSLWWVAGLECETWAEDVWAAGLTLAATTVIAGRRRPWERAAMWEWVGELEVVGTVEGLQPQTGTVVGRWQDVVYDGLLTFAEIPVDVSSRSRMCACAHHSGTAWKQP